jgi:tetratricopeptide (TPR) repeat protein
LRVNVELVDTRSRLQVWSGRFERIADDRRRIHDDIVNALGRELQMEIAQVEGASQLPDPDVYTLIRQGWAAIHGAGRRGGEALRLAESSFTQALARAPDSVQAATGLGAYHVNMALQLLDPEPRAHLEKAEALLQDATARAPNANSGHYYLGVVRRVQGRLGEAAASFERSLALNPSHASSYAALGVTLVGLGRAQDGLEHILYAMRLSPRDPVMAYWLTGAGAAELELKRYERAIAYLERALALNSEHPRALLVLTAAHALSGQMEEARATLERLQKRLPHLSRDALVERLAGGKGPSQFREGLRLALAQHADLTNRAAPAGAERDRATRVK